MSTKIHPMPELNSLKQLLYIDPSSFSGLRNRITRNSRAIKDSVAGKSNGQGYYQVRIKGLCYSAHRLVWYLSTYLDPGFDYIDHCDGDPSNNAIGNLRLTSCSGNSFNRAKSISNTSGYKGVSFNQKKQKWYVQIKANGKHIYLGTYTNIQEAAEVYNQAALEHHGMFARLNKL
jgi:hypothetical protein